MDAADVNEVCRLCPSSIGLLNVFDETISFKYNIREVILVNTGIEVLQTDIVSKKICQKCCKILLKTYEFRLDARKQDRELKERCGQQLGDWSGIRIPNTSVTIKKDITGSSLTNQKIKTEPNKVPSATHTDLKKIHPSVADVFRNYPRFKLPKKCIERHIAPVVALTMGEVETYFKKRKLNMKKFIYKPSTKTPRSRNVAKKKTTLPAKEKTVAPLKISRKLLENHDASEISSDTGYIRVSVPKQATGRKRKISSSSDKSVNSKLSRNNQIQSLSVSTSNTDTPKTTANNVVVMLQTVTANSLTDVSQGLKLQNSSNDIPGTSQHARTPASVSINPLSGNSGPPSPASADPISEDSRDSCSTNISAATSSSTEKPQFMESFGLTPTVTTTKSHTLLVCNLCGSIHHNAFELKRHTSKHMVCQFCKQKFKSVESKQNHVDHSCLIKKVMISPGPIVSLEKIHLKVDVRKKYRNAFTSFELIPGVEEPTPVEEVMIKAASPPPLVAEDAVIVLSDDEDETHARSTDPLSGIPIPSASMPPPAFEDVVYNTVSIVRPDIRVKNNMILNSLVENMTDKELMKDLIQLFKPKQLETTETMLQTDLPASKDIKIHNSEGTCEFMNLKGQLTTYKVPVSINNGSFHVTYQFRDNSKTNKCLALWDSLPIIDVCKKSPNHPDQNKNVKHSNTNVITSSLPKTTEGPLLDVAVSSMQNGTIKFSLPSSTIIQTVPVGTSNNGLVTVQQAISIPGTNIISNNASNSATPLLQNYALSMTSAPVISNPIPIPRTYINSALSNTLSTSNRSASSAAGSNVSKPSSAITIAYNQPLPSSFVLGQPDIAPCSQNTSLLAVPLNPPTSIFSTTNTTFLPPTTTIALSSKTFNSSLDSLSDKTSSPIPAVKEIPKFRVKSVWELQ